MLQIDYIQLWNCKHTVPMCWNWQVSCLLPLWPLFDFWHVLHQSTYKIAFWYIKSEVLHWCTYIHVSVFRQLQL